MEHFWENPHYIENCIITTNAYWLTQVAWSSYSSSCFFTVSCHWSFASSVTKLAFLLVFPSRGTMAGKRNKWSDDQLCFLTTKIDTTASVASIPNSVLRLHGSSRWEKPSSVVRISDFDILLLSKSGSWEHAPLLKFFYNSELFFSQGRSPSFNAESTSFFYCCQDN